jgi:hypothetical protein
MMLRLFSVPLFLVLFVVPSVRSNFLREGFSSKMESDFKGEMRLEENELSNGMTREMFLMKEVEWELQPMDFSGVSDARLRRHVQSFFNGPVKLKLSSRRGKYGLRAMGQLESGRRLRAFWRQSMGGAASAKGTDFMHMSYDEAVRSRLSALEIEVQLPPMKNNKNKKQLPSVVFTVCVEPGTMNAKAVLPRGPAGVKILPEGHDVKTEVIPAGGTAGMSFLTVPMKGGLVDHAWAKGRAVFRRGRSTS